MKAAGPLPHHIVMVKRMLIIATILAIAVVAALLFRQWNTRRHSPYAEVQLKDSSGVLATVSYCRPYRKGRQIFGAEKPGEEVQPLVPYGKVWRTGANEATTFEVERPLLFNGQALAPGRYGLFTIPEEKVWTIILNSEPDQWGAFTYDPSLDVLRVTAAMEPLPQMVEQFKIDLQQNGPLEAQLVFYWEQTRVVVPLVLQE